MAELRDYQEECHDAVLTTWGITPWYEGGDTFRSVLANLATSAGKTVIAGSIIKTLLGRENCRCLFVADTDELCDQPQKSFYKHFGLSSSLEKAGSKSRFTADVVVGSAQTLQREARLHRFHPTHFDYVFIDEAHRGSDRNKVITDYFAGAKVMGMTATAFRAKLADLSPYYQTVAYELGMFDLMNEGYIAPLKVLTLPVNVDISEVHQTGGDFDAGELDTKITPYYREICRMIKEHAPRRQIICFLPLIKSSQEFVKVAMEMGIDARHIDGTSPDREELKEAFANKDFQLLSNSSLLTTGWDCPTCDCLLNLTPTRSAGLFRQKVGRIGRLLPGTIDGITDKGWRLKAIAESLKPDSLILDLLWQVAKYGVQGPADLIAGDDKELDGIKAKLRDGQGALDLQAVTSEVQKKREESLRKALEAVKKRAGKALNYIAALLHLRKVVNYQPVMHWEGNPVSEKQAKWLLKQGVDPESAKDSGHASKLMDALIDRKRKGMASIDAVAVMEAAAIPQPEQKTASQAYELLGLDYPMGFGKKFKGNPLRGIPIWYWESCLKIDYFKTSSPIEYDFAMKRLHRDPEQPRGCTCIAPPHQVAPNCPIHKRVDSIRIDSNESMLQEIFGF